MAPVADQPLDDKQTLVLTAAGQPVDPDSWLGVNVRELLHSDFVSLKDIVRDMSSRIPIMEKYQSVLKSIGDDAVSAVKLAIENNQPIPEWTKTPLSEKGQEEFDAKMGEKLKAEFSGIKPGSAEYKILKECVLNGPGTVEDSKKQLGVYENRLTRTKEVIDDLNAVSADPLKMRAINEAFGIKSDYDVFGIRIEGKIPPGFDPKNDHLLIPELVLTALKTPEFPVKDGLRITLHGPDAMLNLRMNIAMDQAPPVARAPVTQDALMRMPTPSNLACNP